MAAVFISHPYASDPLGNRALVARIARRLSLDGHLPLPPQLLFPHFINEQLERDLALKLCLQLLGLADEVRAYGSPSEGMRLEIAEAERLGISVIKQGQAR